MNSELSKLPKNLVSKIPVVSEVESIGSNHYLQNRKWQFEAKIPYNFVAAEGGADSQNLTFPIWYDYLTKSEPFLNGTDGAPRAPN